MAHLAPILLLVSLASPPAVVVIGPAAGPGARARAQVQAALSRESGVAIRSQESWLRAARVAGVRGRAARSKAAVARIARAAGVDAAVVLTVRGAGPRLRLHAALVDARGSSRWTSTYRLGSRGLTRSSRAAIARSVAESLGPPSLGIDIGAPPRAERPLAAPHHRAERPLASAPARPPSTPSRPEAGGEGDLCGDPALRVEIGMPVAWRNASLSPGSGPGFEYRSSDPYFGVALDVRLAPLRMGEAPAGPSWLQPLELDLALEYAFARTRLADGTTIGSGEQRASLDLVYPWTFPTATRLAVRAGFAVHRFAIDQNDITPTSTRTGARIGLDLRQALGRRWALDAGVRAYPISGPGSDELAQFGPGGRGWGYEVVAGLEGPLPFWRQLSWQLGYDLLHFSDSYSGSGSSSSGGSGASTYHSGTASVVYSL
jgi:hypothetical protein